MPFTEDFNVFFNTEEFASTATIGGVDIAVIFDAQGVVGLNGFVQSVGPQIRAKTADVAARGIVNGTSITINAVVYYVTAIDPDGTGVTTLQLRKT
jgi:hypothetical protein